MTVNRYAVAAGKAYEPALMKYMREQRFDVERLRLVGAEDEGDLLLNMGVGGRFVIEAKREKGFKLGPWLKEAEIEAENYAKHRSLERLPGFVVVHHARGKSIGKSYVTTTLDEWLRQVSE